MKEWQIASLFGNKQNHLLIIKYFFNMSRHLLRKDNMRKEMGITSLAACSLGNGVCLIKVQLPPYTAWLENNETKNKMNTAIWELTWTNKSCPMGGSPVFLALLSLSKTYSDSWNFLQNCFMSQTSKSTSLLYYHTSFLDPKEYYSA